MNTAIMIVRTGPTDPAREDEFNEWLTGQHIPDVLKIDGFGSARRFRASEVTFAPDDVPVSPAYLHIYELESVGTEGDLRRLGDALMEAIQSGAAAISDDLDVSVTTTHFYMPVGESIHSK